MEISSDIYTTVYVLSHNMQWLTFFGGWVKGKRSSDNKKKANIQMSHDQSKELKTMPQKLCSDSQPKSDF